MKSLAKGKRAERSFRDHLRAAGWTGARRGVQYCGTPDSPDVICPELDGFHFEVKHTERGNPFEFLAQAIRDAGPSKIPTLAMRRNLHPFIIVLRAEDFFALLKNCDLEAVKPKP